MGLELLDALAVGAGDNDVAAVLEGDGGRFGGRRRGDRFAAHVDGEAGLGGAFLGGCWRGIGHCCWWSVNNGPLVGTNGSEKGLASQIDSGAPLSGSAVLTLGWGVKSGLAALARQRGGHGS